MFRGGLLLIIMYPVYTAIGIYHAFMLAGCLQGRVVSQHKRSSCIYTVVPPDDEQ